MFISRCLRANPLLIVGIFLAFAGCVRAQAEYDFIDDSANQLIDHDNSLRPVFQKIDTLIRKGDRTIHILHIGDSHIQGGFFTNTVRNMLEETLFLGSSGRGFLFPYTMANTNSPWNYKINYTGEWEACKNIQRNSGCSIGLSGIVLKTKDTLTQISINPNNGSLKYHTRIVKIFHQNDSTSYDVRLQQAKPYKTVRTPHSTEFILSGEIDTVRLIIEKTDSIQSHFTLHGISLETDDPGIVYSAVGVNGADVNAWLRSELLDEHLQLLRPSLITISLGANDAYLKNFNRAEFKSNYRQLIRLLKKNVPNAAIILTTPGDGYRHKKYYNYNYVEARDIVLALAKEEKVAVWDFHTVMGGPNSIYTWYKSGLAQADKLHLTKQGYDLQGELFYRAFLASYYKYLDQLYAD